MEQIINVAMYKAEEITLDGKVYKVDEGVKKLCKKVFRIYFILIGVMCILGIKLAEFMGMYGFLEEITVVIVLLIIFNIFASWVSKKILRKKVV